MATGLSRKDIERWIIASYRADPRETNAGGREAVSWPALYVLRPEDQLALHLWAWCQATGERISDVCAGRGIKRSTFEARRERALRQIEEGLSRHADRMAA
jgi:hypothetical protein